MTETQWYKVREWPGCALATLVIFKRAVKNHRSHTFLKMSLMSEYTGKNGTGGSPATGLLQSSRR